MALLQELKECLQEVKSECAQFRIETANEWNADLVLHIETNATAMEDVSMQRSRDTKDLLIVAYRQLVWLKNARLGFLETQDDD